MSPKVALVTGTSSGIGLATAVQLCKAGFATYATVLALPQAATLEAAAKAAGVSSLLHVMVMDVTSDESVTSGVQTLLSETDNALDVVVANAGYGDMSPPEAGGVDAYRSNLNVNLYGVVRLANAVLPTMRAARAGRFIVTSSIAGMVALPMTPVYNVTKFAVEGYMESMAASYAPVGIHFTVVAPGPVHSDFSKNMTTDPEGVVPKELETVNAATIDFIQALMADAQTTDEVARYFVKAATDEVPQLRYMTHEACNKIMSAKYADLTGEATAKALREMIPGAYE